MQSSTPFATSQKPTLKPRELAWDCLATWALQLSNHSPKLTKKHPYPKVLSSSWTAVTFQVFYHLTKEQYKEVRKNCIESILHTDMMAHQARSIFFWWGTCGTVEPSTLYSHHQPFLGWVCFHRVQPLVGWVCFEEQGGPALLTFNHGFNRWKNSTLTVGWNPSCQGCYSPFHTANWIVLKNGDIEK